MKYVAKYVILLGNGLIVAMLLYPLVHELGHALIAVIVGADVVEIKIFPIPSILSNIKNVGNFNTALIGLGGIIFPFLLTICFRAKNFIIWYMCFTIRGISLIAFGISFMSVVLFRLGKPVVNEDLTQVLKFTPHMAPLYGTLCIFLMAVDVFLIVRSKPIQRCEEFIK